VVFEVLSPTSGRTDRIEKVREYAAVPSMRRYVILETRSAGLLVLHRQNSTDAWTVSALTIEDTLSLPEVGIEIPVAEFYEDVEFIDTLAE
jgi:Uma2 family endonuclease